MFLSLGTLFAGISNGSNSLGNEKVVFWREAATGMSASSYFLAKFFSDIPRICLSSIVFSLALILFFPYRTSFLNLYIISLLLYFCAFGMGYFLASILTRDKVALAGTAMTLVLYGLIVGMGYWFFGCIFFK